MKINYGTYQFRWKEWMELGAQCAGICIGINYLFYKSFWAFVFMVPIPFLFYKWKKRNYIRERKKQLNYQFKDALYSLNAALQAGYSMESAVICCIRDLEKLYPENADILREFRCMETQMHISVPLETLFLDLAERSKLEDVENFAAVFAAAKRSGGDLSGIVQKTARMLTDKIEVKKEIEATVAAKKMEQVIMSAMPFGIIVYMQVTSPGFLQVLYGNIFGVITMSLCLGIYFLAYWMGCRIVDIEV